MRLPQFAPPKPLLALEFTLLYLLLPALLLHLQRRGPIPFLPILLGLSLLTLLLALTDPSVRLHTPRTAPIAKAHLPRILRRAAAAALLLTLLTLLLTPQTLLILPRTRPALWLLILLLYPLLSVLPQHLLFRLYFLQRYPALFGNGIPLLLVNALCFGWAHAFFLNPLAPLLTAPAGLLFATTWLRTRNTPLTCLEHALYGQLLFTLGLGTYFYSGTARAVQTLLP